MLRMVSRPVYGGCGATAIGFATGSTYIALHTYRVFDGLPRRIMITHTIIRTITFLKIRLALWGGFWYSNCVLRIGSSKELFRQQGRTIDL